MVDHWHVSTPARADHHPSPWYRFEGSGLPVHHFDDKRHGKRRGVKVSSADVRRVSLTPHDVAGVQGRLKDQSEVFVIVLDNRLRLLRVLGSQVSVPVLEETTL